MSEGVPLHGDRGAYNLDYETEHASDINAGVLTRHHPAPTLAGRLSIDQGAEWQSKTISGAASLAADGTLTLTGIVTSPNLLAWSWMGF